jgi:hypothetical protein
MACFVSYIYAIIDYSSEMLDRKIRHGWCSHCQVQTTPFLDVSERAWSTKVSSLPLTTEVQLCLHSLLIPYLTIRDDQLAYVCFQLLHFVANKFALHAFFGNLMRCNGEGLRSAHAHLFSLRCSACTLFIYPMARRRLLHRRIVVARCPHIYAL